MPFANYPDFGACVLDQKGKGHDEESAKRICGALQAKTEAINIRENVNLYFTPSFEVKESGEEAGRKWLRIGGVALTEGLSKNNNRYTIKNLQENDKQEFKWIVSHPRTDLGEHIEPHVVGKGSLALSTEGLLHDGKIRNTATHPDIVEGVQDGFYGPSIHAFAKKITRKDGAYEVEGLNIKLIGLVACQGVEKASIDYAIAESFDLKESTKVDEYGIEDNKEEIPMEETKPVAAPSVSVEEFKAVQAELTRLHEERKNQMVEAIKGFNKDLKSEDLMKESENQLKMRLEYEKRLTEKAQAKSQSVSESEPAKASAKTPDAQFVENEHGFSISEGAWRDFNKELKERVM